MRILKDLSFEDIAFEVCSAFERAGVLAVLSGGGAATIQAPKAYQTQDFDFVLHLELFGMPSDTPLVEIGVLHEQYKSTYKHPAFHILWRLQGPSPLAGALKS